MSHASKHFTIVGLGEILWDLLPGGKQLGGAPANFAFHAQALGAQSYVVSAVGDDMSGHEILDRLKQLGLDSRYIAIDDDHPTGTVSVALDADGTPDFTIHENVAWDFIPLSDDMLRLASKVDAVCYGSLAQRSDVSRKTILSFIRATSGACLRVYDVNLRQSFYSREIINETLALSHVLKLNDEELPLVAELCAVSGNETEILQQLLTKYNLKLIALTRGKNGSRLFTPDEDSGIAGKSLPVADSVGAGDAFTAALVMGLIKKLPIATIHRQADALASFVCTQKGATPILPKDQNNPLVATELEMLEFVRQLHRH